MKKSLFTLFACILSMSIYAANFFCSPIGNGSGNSFNDPCSFAAGVTKLSAGGDTLFCLEGQYDLTATINITLVGSAGKNIVICNYPNHKPILDWRQQAYGNRGIVVKSGSQYLTIKGLTLRYTGKNALLNNGSYCTFENLDAYGNGDTGIQMKGGGNNYIINCDSHDNFDYQLGNTNAADFGGNADGFADKQFTGDANTYIGCRAWNNSDDGWDFFQRYTNGTPIIMQNCICYNNGPAFYNMTNHGRLQTDDYWFSQFKNGITVTHKNGQQVQASLEKYPNMGNGNGFKLGGANTTNDVNLYQCLAVKNTARGFDQNNNYGKMVIYNGSAYLNGTDYGFSNNGGGQVTIINSISYTNSQDIRMNNTQSNNSWSANNLKPTEADFISIDTTEILSPRNADFSLPEILFMHLQPNSKFIDAGVDVGLPYNGNAPDLGCYEYGSTINYPATLTCTTANLTQGIKLGNSIANITLQWGGSATGATTSELPQGLNSTINNANQTITISGTPQTTGTLQFTIMTEGGTSEAKQTATIVVKDNSAIEIGYVTLPGNNADKLILNQLNANPLFSTNILDATSTTNSYDPYQLIIISPVPSSTAAAMPALKGIDKPMLLLKPFMLKNTVWNWGNSQNTGNTTMTITQPEHPIFKNITLNGNQLQCFDAVNTNGVTYIASWYSQTEPIRIATPEGIEGSAIAEIQPGTDMNGTIINQRFLMIGVSEYSTANLTTQALQLIENACYYLLGKDIPTSTITEQQNENIIITENTIYAENATQMQLFDTTGRLIASTKNNTLQTTNLPTGIYIISINQNTYKKIRIK